jgi:hypothetical protein
LNSLTILFIETICNNFLQKLTFILLPSNVFSCEILLLLNGFLTILRNDMNKLVLMSLLCFCILLTACGGGSDSDKGGVTVAVNNAPIIDIASTQRLTAGQSVTFTADISDPDGDAITVAWQADNVDVSFSTTTGTSTTISFPDVTTEQVREITITATDSKGKSTKKIIIVTLGASILSNEAPIISLPENQEAKGGDSIVLVATVQDPQDDNVTVEWRSANNTIVFSDTHSLTPTLTLPEVTSTTTIIITLIATDSQNNSSEKTLLLTIIPSDGEPAPSVQFELTDRFETSSGGVTTLTAKFTSNVEITAINWDLSALGDVNASEENTPVNNVTTTNVTFTAPSLTVAKAYAISLNVTTLSGAKFSADSQVFVAVDNVMTLDISLAESYVVDESSTISITPEITHSHAISSYLWQWSSDQEITLSTPTSKILSLSTPSVDADITGQLSFTVTMGTLTKTLVTDLTIKNEPVTSEVDVVVSRLVAVEGQTIKLSVITDNFEQITAWSWENLNVQGVNIKESKTGYEITAPLVQGQQNMSIVYRATLSDNTTIQKVANVTILSKSMARSSIDIKVASVPVIKSNVETVVEFPFSDSHGLVDSLSLDTNNTFNSFEKAEVSLVGGKVVLVLKIGDFSLPVDHSDYVSILVKLGAHEIPFVIELAMDSD